MAVAAGPTGRSTGVTRHPLVGCHKEGTTQYGYQWARRYRRGALILTTNRVPANVYPLFPNPDLAEGFLDRLLNSAYVVTMLGRSYRPRQRPGADGKEVLADGPQPA